MVMQYVHRKTFVHNDNEDLCSRAFQTQAKNTHSALFANLKASSPYQTVKHFMVIWFTIYGYFRNNLDFALKDYRYEV